MLKKRFKIIFYILLIWVSTPLFCLADVGVIIVPKAIISTSNSNLNEGDSVDFVVAKDVLLNNKVVIKKGEIVTGIVLELIPNDWSTSPARVKIGQFVTKDIDNNRKKLSGEIFRTGTAHDIVSAIFSDWAIRGGEVHMLPNSDSFIIFLKETPVFAAERIPVSITPTQLISTCYDEVEVGDELTFKAVKDVYLDDNLVIKQGAPALALVDYISDNGFAADSAYIQIKKFKILDTQRKWITISYPLKIIGLKCRDPKAHIVYKGVHSLAFIIRGDEVNLKPGQKKFNIFITK